MDHHRRTNKEMWNERAPAHAASADYGFESFAGDPAHLSDVVRFDLPRLGDVTGLDGVHLQCHIGTDTVSLARLGARMIGLDFSDVSLEQARALAAQAGAEVDFVQADVYDAPAALAGRTFDLVYTGVGALIWLPEIRPWARVVAQLLRPGGRLFLREGHPVLFSLADARADGELVLEYSYFEHTEPVRWDEDGTYVDTDVSFSSTVSYEWNHGLGEIVTALLDEGLQLTRLEEHDSVPWEALGRGYMVTDAAGEHRLADRPERLPASFTLEAVRPG
ncbi:MAG: class I SAM-dependent methyltransferase [Gaiella sp.]